MLDEEATDAVRQERLHQKVATVVFFESNGGMVRSEATVPEIRMAVGHPDLDLGNIETALDALGGSRLLHQRREKELQVQPQGEPEQTVHRQESQREDARRRRNW